MDALVNGIGFSLNLFLTIIGILGNLLLFLSCFQQVKLCVPINVFLLAHAVFAIFWQTLNGILLLIFYLDSTENAGYFYCVVIRYSTEIGVVLQVVSTLATAVYRYCSVIRPHPVEALKKWTVALTTTAVTYTAASLLVLVGVLVSEQSYDTSTMTSLHWCESSVTQAQTLLNFLLACIVMTSFLIVTCLTILKSVRKAARSRVMPDNSQPSGAGRGLNQQVPIGLFEIESVARHVSISLHTQPPPGQAWVEHNDTAAHAERTGKVVMYSLDAGELADMPVERVEVRSPSPASSLQSDGLSTSSVKYFDRFDNIAEIQEPQNRDIVTVNSVVVPPQTTTHAARFSSKSAPQQLATLAVSETALALMCTTLVTQLPVAVTLVYAADTEGGVATLCVTLQNCLVAFNWVTYALLSSRLRQVFKQNILGWVQNIATTWQRIVM